MRLVLFRHCIPYLEKRGRNGAHYLDLFKLYMIFVAALSCTDAV